MTKKKSQRKRLLRYLTAIEEKQIKSIIAYEVIERRIRTLVIQANKINGLVTIQSCQGYLEKEGKYGPEVSPAFISFRCTERIATWILSGVLRDYNIRRCLIDYYYASEFDIQIEVDPAETNKLQRLFQDMIIRFGEYKED